MLQLIRVIIRHGQVIELTNLHRTGMEVTLTFKNNNLYADKTEHSERNLHRRSIFK